MDYDAWLESDPDDAEWCHEHGYAVPCQTCQAEHQEYRAECAREERR